MVLGNYLAGNGGDCRISDFLGPLTPWLADLFRDSFRNQTNDVAMRRPLLPFFLLLSCFAYAQDSQMDNQSNADAMPSHHHMQMGSQSFLNAIEQHSTSGTDAESDSTPAPMIMKMENGWMLMFHGEAFLNETQQSGLRGGDKFFSTNWFMPMAQHKFSNGTLTLRTMISLEPATVTQRRYPELFQQGETAFGRPIVDGQHPHDFFMELAALYDYKVGKNTLLSFYAAPMGDPAMGPIAYPHRASASEDPLAPLGHHLEDSTHIAADVITAGLAYRDFRIEGSGFHGREPDENRW